MNILISGWPGAGSSTAAKILALTLNMKYLYGGGVLKHWADSMGYDSKTNAINDWMEKYGDKWNSIWEKYIIEKQKQIDDTIIDAKLVGFFVEKAASVQKFYIIASNEARRNRAGSDQRLEDIEKRDDILKNSWIEKYGINIFDTEQLKKNYDHVIDTSEIGIKEVALKLLDLITQTNYSSEIEAIMKSYESELKFLENELKKRSLYYAPEQVLAEILKDSRNKIG